MSVFHKCSGCSFAKWTTKWTNKWTAFPVFSLSPVGECSLCVVIRTTTLIFSTWSPAPILSKLHSCQQLQKCAFAAAAHFNFFVVKHNHTTAFAFDVFFDVIEVDQIGVMNPEE
jgi:hypothetical protein